MDVNTAFYNLLHLAMERAAELRQTPATQRAVLCMIDQAAGVVRDALGIAKDGSENGSNPAG